MTLCAVKMTTHVSRSRFKVGMNEARFRLGPRYRRSVPEPETNKKRLKIERKCVWLRTASWRARVHSARPIESTPGLAYRLPKLSSICPFARFKEHSDAAHNLASAGRFHCGFEHGCSGFTARSLERCFHHLAEGYGGDARLGEACDFGHGLLRGCSTCPRGTHASERRATLG